MVSPAPLNFSPVSYKTNYLFTTVVLISTILSTVYMICGATQLRLHSDFFQYMLFFTGTLVTGFNVTILVFKSYLLKGNLYLVS